MHDAESHRYPTMPQSPIGPPRPPAAAAAPAAPGQALDDAPLAPPDRGAVSSLFLLTSLSAVDGTLVLLAASGHLDTLGGAIAVGLTVIAGAGAWLAARQAFAGRRGSARDAVVLVALGATTLVGAVGATWLGVRLGQSLTLHVLPKAAGVILFLVAAEVGGLRVPRPRGVPHAVPLPVAAVGLAVLLEVLAQWIP